MTALKEPSFVSIEDYLDGEDGAESKHVYLGGVVHAMAGGTNDHAAISANALVALGSQLRGKPCRVYSSDARVRIEFADHTRFYYPAAQVSCEPGAGSQRFQDRPTVVVEVLSESTRRTDMGEKGDAYLTIPSLKVLVLVESDLPRVLIYRRRTEGGFNAEEYSGCEGHIELPEIQAALSLGELYDGITFEQPLPER